MSRPKDADPKQTRERILQCACDLLSETQENFSLRAVARRADVSIGTLQYHFADKQSLTDACIDTVYDTFKDMAPTMGSHLAVSKSKHEFIDRAVRFGFKYTREHQPFIRILESSIVENGGLDLTRHNTTQEPFLTNAGKLLGADLNLSEAEIQLRLNSIVLLIGRYSILQESAMAALFQVPEGRTVVEVVEEHLVALAQALLAPGPPPAPTPAPDSEHKSEPEPS